MEDLEQAVVLEGIKMVEMQQMTTQVPREVGLAREEAKVASVAEEDLANQVK